MSGEESYDHWTEIRVLQDGKLVYIQEQFFLSEMNEPPNYTGIRLSQGSKNFYIQGQFDFESEIDDLLDRTTIMFTNAIKKLLSTVDLKGI